MNDSRVGTYEATQITGPPVGEAGTQRVAQPALIANAGQVPARVVVRNASALGQRVVVAYESGAIQEFPFTARHFPLPAGQETVFMLAPRQSLYAASSSAGATISVAISDALPLEVARDR